MVKWLSSDPITNDDKHPIDQNKDFFFFSNVLSDIVSVSNAILMINRNYIFSPPALWREYIVSVWAGKDRFHCRAKQPQYSLINTQLYPQVWLALLVVVATASVVQAQFRFPLPSPPRILFGGFRPLFSRPRPRPRPRPPVLVPANQFLQQQQVSFRSGEVESASLRRGFA